MKSPLRFCVVATVCAFSFLVASLYAAAQASMPIDQPVSANSSAQTGNVFSEFTIPGPLRSFLRMAGISQKISPEEVLPLLSRNVFTQGYEGSSQQTEFLILLSRYVVQSRELASLAASNGMVIRVTNCDDAKPLLHILGYRTRPDCGKPGTILQTEDARRAFLTTDSGFPLPELEQTLEGGKPFEYPYPASSVPVLFAESDWTMASKKNYTESSKDLINTLLADPSIARLYWAFSKMDPPTASILRQQIGIRKLAAYAPVLDFYGSRICIRDGRVLVPGRTGAEAYWKEMVGANPSDPTTFIPKLLAKDKGWMAAYFDVLSRVSARRQAYFTDPRRIRVFYAALRTPDPSATATTGLFRPAPAMLLLVTRLQWDNNAEPLVPGDLNTWTDIIRQSKDSRTAREWRKHVSRLTSPDQLVQSMFALSRAITEQGAVQMYMAISELDSRRPADHRLSPATVLTLARKFEDFSDQYRIFAEFPELDDTSITTFLDIAQTLTTVPNAVRGDALGTFQANVGIWQILARQGQIPPAELNSSWQQVIKPFAKIRSSSQLYDAGRASLTELFRASTGKARGSQDEIIELLAGPRQTTADGRRVHQELARRIRSVMDAQRLVSLDTLLTLGDALREEARGKAPEDATVRLAGQTREFEMPRPIFTNGERTEWAPGIYNNHHTDVQMRTDVVKVLKSPNTPRTQIEEARGQLAPFLRDTLVGLNYAYYEPPGSQALHNNPLFVRSHDFASETVSGLKTLWQAPQLLGQGSPAGGGAHFVGSLADLPYALADLEQDFISPDNVQALIWKELTPGVLTSAILPRWWDVSQEELHAVTLYQKAGEEILAAAVSDEPLRNKVTNILSARIVPKQLNNLEQALQANRVSEIVPRIMPADTFYLASEFQLLYPDELSKVGPAGQELQDLCQRHPDEINWKRLSHDFGVPHPSIAETYGDELLNVAPMPAFSGSASRFLAESWESPNLYWARLADEKGYSAVMLNQLVPELSRRMVEKIFATDLEDWPALLRAMRETGADFREGKLGAPTSASANGPVRSSGNPSADTNDKTER